MAVVAVVAYHAGIPGFTGGFVGVDVFFVISGFLITGLLAREVESTGHLSVAGFYGRRARRLLPMAAVVTVATVAVGWWVLSPLARRDLATDALATSTYTINLRLAAQQLDYLRANLAPSAFQQFWSLAVEEQFYLIWPLVMLAALRGRAPRRCAVIVVAVLCLLSFVLALAWVVPSPSWAFFSLPTRAWQLGLGALVALGWGRIEAGVPRAARRVLPGVGLVAIVASVVMFDDGTPWPAWWAVVPTVATLLVLMGLPVGQSGLASALGAAPARWVGVRSYSWYLWHWPAMVLLAAALDRSIGGWPAIVAGLGTLGLASLTYRVVEQPVRRSPRLVASPRRSVALGLGATAVLAVLFLALMAVPGEVVGPGQRAEDIAQRALDARRLDEAALVEQVPSNLVPGLVGADQDIPAVYDDGCHREVLQDAPVVCSYGDVDAGRRVVLVGDSHAAQWVPALDELGHQRGFTLVPLTKAGCPAAAVTVHDGLLGRRFTECERWRDATIELVRDLQPDLVVISNTSQYAVDGDGEPPTDEAWLSGYEATLTESGAVAPTVLLGDTPHPMSSIPDCLVEHLSDVPRCVLDRDELDGAHFATLEQRAAEAANVAYASTTDLLCGAQRCPVVVGNVLVYRDASHLTATYARRLAPRLADVLEAAVPDDNPVVAADG